MHFDHVDFAIADEADLDASIHEMKKLPQFSIESGDTFTITVENNKVTLKVNDKDYGVIIDDDKIGEQDDVYACITFSRYDKQEGDKI